MGHSRDGIRVAAFLALVYGLTASGHFYTSDAGTKLEVARRLVNNGSWALDPDTKLNHIVAPDGRRFAPWAPGTILAMVPAAWIEARVGPLEGPLGPYLPVTILCFTSIVLLALSGFLVHRLAGFCGASPGDAIRLALIFGLTTQAWTLSKTAASEVIVTFLTLLVAERLLRPAPSATDRFVAGVLGAVGALVYYPCFLLLPIIWILPLVREGTRPDLGPGLPFAVSLLLIGAYNRMRTGEVLNTGYPPSILPSLLLTLAVGTALSALIAILWMRNRHRPRARESLAILLFVGAGTVVWWRFDSLFMVFLSPGDGILYHSPTLLLLAWALPAWGQPDPRLAMSLGLLAAPFLLPAFHTLVSTWLYGSRYMVPAMPFLVLLLAPVLRLPPTRPIRRGFVKAMICMGVLIQLAGTLGPFHVFRDHALKTYIARLGTVPPFKWHELERQTVIDPRKSSIQFHVRQLTLLEWSPEAMRERAETGGVGAIRGHIPDQWWAYACAMGAPPTLVLTVLGMGWLMVMGMAWSLWRRLGAGDPRTDPATGAPPPGTL